MARNEQFYLYIDCMLEITNITAVVNVTFLAGRWVAGKEEWDPKCSGKGKWKE
jgi:hypothetical protein